MRTGIIGKHCFIVAFVALSSEISSFTLNPIYTPSLLMFLPCISVFLLSFSFHYPVESCSSLEIAALKVRLSGF